MVLLYLQALIQGIVEGLTEFLPVSSTGHMILVNRTFLEMDKQFSDVFEIVIQLGAILSVLVYFRRRVFDGLFSSFSSPAWRLWKKVLTAVFPALVLGGIFGGLLQEYLFNPMTVAVMLILGGIALLVVENPKFFPCKAGRIEHVDELSWGRAAGIGLIQCFAMIPGTSRSAATIIGGMLLGCSRKLAAEFSFFLAIPTMMAASGYSLLKHGMVLNGTQWIALGIGFLTAFLVAWGVIAFLMAFIQKHDFRVFAWYRIALGSAVILLTYL